MSGMEWLSRYPKFTYPKALWRFFSPLVEQSFLPFLWKSGLRLHDFSLEVDTCNKKKQLTTSHNTPPPHTPHYRDWGSILPLPLPLSPDSLAHTLQQEHQPQTPSPSPRTSSQFSPFCAPFTQNILPICLSMDT